MSHAPWHFWSSDTPYAGTAQTETVVIQAPVASEHHVRFDPSGESAHLAKINALSPEELMEHNFDEYQKKYPKDYGESSTDLFADPRMEGFLTTAKNIVEYNLTPNALPDGQTEAVVLAIGPGSAPPYSSRDTTVKAQSTNANNLYKSFTLTCYDLKAPSTCYVTANEAAWLEPWALVNLPKFRGTWQSGMTMPTLGDIVKVQYDKKSYRSGEFISVVPDQNIAHMLRTTDRKKENIETKFAKQRYDAMNLADFKKLSKDEILECADEYDAKYKEMRGPYIDDNGNHHLNRSWSSNQSTYFNRMDTRMIPYAKCFIWRCWKKEKILIKMNSAYRTLVSQRRLRLSWLRGQQGGKPAPTYATQDERMYPMGTDPATIPNPAPAGMFPEVSTRGTSDDATKIAGPSHGSMHNAAMAMDFNPIFPDGSRLGLYSDRHAWFSKGAKVVRIGKQMGLKWGGEFGHCANRLKPKCTGWDPIHFDMRDILGMSSKGPAMAKLVRGDESGLG